MTVRDPTVGAVLPLAVTGLLTGLSLIVAIGAQNAFVLRQGLAREHVGAVVSVCALSDLVLIVAGVAGIGTVVRSAPWAIEVVRWFGVAFLLWYGLSSLRRALTTTESLATNGGGEPTHLRPVLVKTVALTWLNPHVYLDTVLLLGSIANQHGSTGRWWFALGACAGSIVWFSAIGFGARLASPLLTSARAWRVLDTLIGVTMLWIAVKLARG